MELQWERQEREYLRCHTRQVQNLEQTQEIRLPEGMPDIGRVLCAWGQCLLQGKQWRNEGMQVTGVVQVWVLYAPEDGSEPRSVEAQLPFTGKYPFADSKREGYIRVDGQVCRVDGRALSSRKLMVRAAVSLLAEALEMTHTEIYTPPQGESGVQLLKRTYPAVIPSEAGEKLFAIEEGLTLPSVPRKILSCMVQPLVTEQAAAGSRVVFRGECRAHIVYMDEHDRLMGTDQILPFAQMAELDREYDKDATAEVMMVVTEMECRLEAGNVLLSCSLVGQYVICRRWMLEVAEDAYCPHCEVQLQMQPLVLPLVLESRQEKVTVSAQQEANVNNVVDVICMQEQPTVWRDGDQVLLETPCTFQILYYDEEGNLRALHQNGSGRLQLPAGEDCLVTACIAHSDTPQTMPMGMQLQMENRITLHLCAHSQQQIPMLTAVTVGKKLPDRKQVSLILQRMGEGGLWELAKNCDSTVDAILKANPSAAEPQPGQMLLIPVM